MRRLSSRKHHANNRPIQPFSRRDLATPFAPNIAPNIADPARISVNDQGRLVLEVDAPTGKCFYLMKVGP